MVVNFEPTQKHMHSRRSTKTKWVIDIKTEIIIKIEIMWLYRRNKTEYGIKTDKFLIEQTWLFRKVAMRKLALIGLKVRLESESLGGCATCILKSFSIFHLILPLEKIYDPWRIISTKHKVKVALCWRITHLWLNPLLI